MWLFVLIVAVPLIEIALFVTVGGWLGLWATLAIVLGTGMLGVMILRGQGRLARGMMARANMARGMTAAQNPLVPVAHGALIAFAAILLILPGFLTDTLGLLLLIAPVRRGILALVSAQVSARAARMGVGARRQAGPQPDIIDAEVLDEVPGERGPQPPSGWTRH